MQKLIKRTLAFMLVVSMLCGMLVMSASAVTANPDEETGNFVYDFTVLGDAPWDITADVISPGAGYCNLLPGYYTSKVVGNSVVPALYNKGSYTFMNGEDEITTTLDLNWRVSAASHDWEGYGDNVQAGGPHYRYNMSSGAGVGTDGLAYDGLMYLPGGASTRYYVGGWFAVTLKTPYVGSYSVTLEYTKASDAAKQGSVYILPGTPSDAEIDAAIAAGTGKLANTVNYNGTASTGNTIALGNVNINQICEEYTVVFTSELDNAGKTAADYAVGTVSGSARLYVDKLTLTPIEAQTASTLYDFQVRSKVDASLTDFTEDDALLTSYYENGTIDWDYIGCSESQASESKTLNSTYAYIKGTGSSGWYAFMLRSPGSGIFNLEMTTYTPAANKTQVWTDAYIAEYSEGMDYSTVIADSNFVGSIRPERSDAGAAGNFVTDAFGSKEFTAGKDYVLVLNINPDIYTINKDHSTVSPIGDAFMTNHLYIQSIKATEVPQSVAQIGETVVPPADKTYDFDLNGQDSTTFANDTYLDDVRTEISNLYATNDWDYLGSTQTYTGNYVPKVSSSGYILFSGMGTAAKPSYAAFKLKSPGAGEFALDMTVYNMAAAGYDAGHLWLNAYLVKIDGTTVTAENYAAALENATVTGEFKPEHSEMEDGKMGTAPLLTATFEEGAEYILFLERHPASDNTKGEANTDPLDPYSPNNIYLNAITAKSTVVASTAAEYLTLSEALADAKSGDTIKLVDDVVLGTVSIPEGVTLDLNGNTLTTSNFSTAAGGKIIDSVGTGLINVLSANAYFLGDNALAEGMLPIYDAEAMGYRFFEYTYNAWGTDDDAQYENGIDGAVRFWYQFQFKDDAAYELIAAGNSGVQWGVNVKLNGDVVSECTFKYADESEGTWMQDWANAKAAWLWVRIQGAEGVEGLSIAPVITAGNADIELAPVA